MNTPENKTFGRVSKKGETLGPPISVSEYRSYLQALDVPSRYCIAVSGGSDSMALAVLAGQHQRQSGGNVEILALTVDHGLRAESTREAETVKNWCEALGLSCCILTWQGDKPKSGVQATARLARYRLLYKAASSDGYKAVLTAHTADDQAETVFMRLARGAGPGGLGAMGETSKYAIGADTPIDLVRPFLSATRSQLRATLSEYGQNYLNDPSNDNLKYERVRVRLLLQSLEADGNLSRQALVRTAKEARAANALLARQEQSAFAKAGGVFYRWGGASLGASSLIEPAANVLFRQLIFAISGAENPPGRDAVEEAIGQLAAGKSSASLGGVIVKHQSGKLWVYREPSALLGRAGVAPAQALCVNPHQTALWDRRFIVTNQSDEVLDVSSCGRPNVENMGESLLRNFGAGAPREALWSAPAARARKGDLVAAPDGPHMRGVDFRFLGEERFCRLVRRYSA